MTAVEQLKEAEQKLAARVHGPGLAGGWRIAAISAWAAIWLMSLAAFIAATAIWYHWDSTPAAQLMQSFAKVTAQEQAFYVQYQSGIYQLGMSLAFYAGFFAALRLISGIPYFILSILVMRRRSDRLMAVLFAVFLPVAGAAGRWIAANWRTLPGLYPWSTLPLSLLNFILDLSVILFYTFPDGRFVPRWTRWFALAAFLLSFLHDFYPGSPVDPSSLPGVLGMLPDRILLLAGIVALAYRYRRDASAVQKQQIKWMVFGAGLLVVIYFIEFFMMLYPQVTGHDLLQNPRQILISEMIEEPGWYIGQFFFAICIGLAVFRNRLWDIDLVINRVLVYGSLTLLTMGVYLVTVTLLGSLFRAVADPVLFFLATGLVAILFEPLRQRLQRLVNRLMYGERDDPYAVLTRLSNALEHASTPGEVLHNLAATVGQALRIPYVAIQIDQNGERQTVAVHGTRQLFSSGPEAGEQVFPMVYQGETVGSLLVSARARGEVFSSSDRRLIENIARQAGPAVEAVRLNAELIRSRAGIVTTREEERRRLRRDLHDGLGSALASQTLKMAAVRQLVRQSPERAEMLVDDVIQQNEHTVSEVRRLVYGLRPPALDELGLVEAVRDLLRRSGEEDFRAGGLAVEIDGPQEGLPRLPAAVETNAYRIALEGLTNVARHAQARQCSIHFACEEESRSGGNGQVLVVRISDDGAGMPDQFRAGVGLRSMRERAEELGGGLRIEPLSPHGTRITAWLPLAV